MKSEECPLFTRHSSLFTFDQGRPSSSRINRATTILKNIHYRSAINMLASLITTSPRISIFIIRPDYGCLYHTILLVVVDNVKSIVSTCPITSKEAEGLAYV